MSGEHFLILDPDDIYATDANFQSSLAELQVDERGPSRSMPQPVRQLVVRDAVYQKVSCVAEQGFSSSGT